MPEHLTLSDIESDQVRDLMRYVDEAVHGRGWGLDWKDPVTWRNEPGR